MTAFPGKRMVDRLLAQQQFFPMFPPEDVMLEKLADFRDTLADYLCKSQVFEVTNVSDFFYSGSDKNERGIYEDFPSLAAPYPITWMEFAAPKTINEGGKIITPISNIKRFGALIITDELPEELKGATEASSQQVVQVFVEYTNGDIVGPGMTYVWGLDKEGKGVRISEKSDIIYTSPILKRMSKDRFEIEKHLLVMAYPALLAMTFLNCRNTVVSDQTPDGKLSHIHRKEHGRPLVRFKTLQIEQVRKVLSSAQGGDGSIKRSLHLCRGHFKSFGEKGLFGKHKGLFWWGHSIRGTASRGIVEKDYQVK